jgi:hypothetical protein
MAAICMPDRRQHGTVETRDVFVVQPTHELADLGLWRSADLVDRQTGGHPQTIAFGPADRQAKQRRFGLVGRESADRDRAREVEAILLDDDDRARLARVVVAASECPDFAALHSSFKIEVESMKA